MGKRKKGALNVVKVDLGSLIIKKSETLLVLVQHLSRDGRRIERSIHKIPAIQPDPPPLSFDPCPVVMEEEDDVFIEAESSKKMNGGDRVRSCFFAFISIFIVSDWCVGCS